MQNYDGKNLMTMHGEFDVDNMMPDDCVRLVEMMNELVITEITRAAEDGSILEIDKASIAMKMIKSTGLSFEDIVRYCEIGEYLTMDRELRGASEEEIEHWRYKREAAVAMIESLLEQAVRLGIVDEDDVERDPVIDQLEDIWKNS